MTTSHELMPKRITAGLFSEDQWRQVLSLLERLDERQSLWLSGFLAAHRQETVSQTSSSADARPVCIAFGSETGNCELLARRLGQALEKHQVAHRVRSLAEVKPRALACVNYLLIICSTHGDGDPPEPIAAFYDGLMSEQAPRLVGTQFAVLALGDSSYERFCTAGKRIDERLEKLGASRLVARCDCDVDFEEPAQQWMAQVVECLPCAQAVQTVPAARATHPTSEAAAPSRQNPLSVEVLENVCLSNGKRAKPIHHIELLVEPSRLQLTPGDAVGILPHNPPDLVAAILDAAGFSGDEPVTVNHRAMPLVGALREHLDLTIPSTAFLNAWAEASESDELRQRCQMESKALRQFLRSVQIIDLLRAHSASADAQTFVGYLRPLQPRLYDLANEVTPDTDELHLTVKDFHYVMNGRERKGIASRYLLQLQRGEDLRIYPHHNKRFHLPDDKDAPLILVANGTGIAPYRAFFQSFARKALNQTCWLVFQETSAEEDFLYQLDIQQAARQGSLRHLDTLFTADQPDRHLGDVFHERADRLLGWLAGGAHLYVCGEKAVLGQCEQVIKTLCEAAGRSDLWKTIIQAKRVHRNLY